MNDHQLASHGPRGLVARSLLRFAMPMAACMLTFGLLQPAQAQPLPLTANYTQLARIAAGTTSGKLTFNVDPKAKLLLVDIASTVDSLTTSIQPPGGGVITETSVVGLGGSFTKVDGNAASGPLVFP